MRWGLYYLPTSLPATPGECGQRFHTLTAQVRYAERLGFQSVWLAEHHFHAFGGTFASPAVIGAALAQHTERMRIGTGVILLPYHNPLRVAEDYATLDALSGGRFEFGVGHGFVKWETLNFEVPLEEVRERFREHLQIVLQAWTGTSLSYQGRFHRYERLAVWPRPVQQPHPTVWMAATASEESFEFAGRQGYHLMLIPFLHPVEELRKKVRHYLDAYAAAGHDPAARRILAVYHLFVGNDLQQAKETASRGVMEYIQASSGAHALTAEMAEPGTHQSHAPHRAALRQLSFNDLWAGRRVVAGDPACVTEHLAYLQEQLSLTDVAGLFALGGLSDQQTRASMELFMERVAPALATAAPGVLSSS